MLGWLRILLTLVLGSSPALAELTDGLSFYCDFDGSANAYFARGEPAEAYQGTGVRLVKGLVGLALRTGRSEGGVFRSPDYQSQSNLATTGSLAFWINASFPWSEPGKAKASETYRVFLNVPGFEGNFGFLLYHYTPPGAEPSRIYFCTYDPVEDRQSYIPCYTFPADSAPWQLGEWHHLVFVWTPHLKQILLDGEKVAEASTDWTDEKFHFESPMTLGLRPDVGSDNYVPMAAAFDEWAIWTRTLSPQEIRQVFQFGRAGRSLREALNITETKSPSKQRIAQVFRNGNLIPNGSFELWMRQGWAVEGLNEFAPPVETGGGTKPAHGQACARLPLRAAAPGRPPGEVVLRHQLFRARPDAPITFSAYARSDAPGAKMELRTWPSYIDDQTHPVARSFDLSREWQRYHFTFTASPSPWDAYFPEIALTADREGTAWVDAVQIEPGPELTPFRPYENLEVGVTTDQAANLFLIGEPLKLRLGLFAETAVDVGRLEIRILDYRGKTVLSQPAARGHLAAGRQDLTLRPALRQTGAFRVEVRQGDKLLEETIVALVPKPRTDVNLDTTNAGGHWVLNREHSRLMRRLGIRWARVHDCSTITWWPTVERERGRFVFDEEPVKALAAEGCEALGVLSWAVPQWAREDKEDRQFPFKLDDWARYVKATVHHYKPWIRHWEVWNEAGGGPSPDRYADLLRVSHDAIKQADSKAVVVAPSTFPDAHCDGWNQRVMVERGGLGRTDLFSFHYGGWDAARLSKMRTLAVSDGRQRAVWNTETNEGWACDTFYTRFLPYLTTPYIRWMGKPRKAAELADISPRLYISNRAAGVDRIFYYWFYYERSNFAGPRHTSWCGFEFDGTLKPRTVSFAVALSLLDGARFERTLEAGPSYRVYVFRHDDQATIVFWCEKPEQTGKEQVRLTRLPPEVVCFDVMGNRNMLRTTKGVLGLPSDSAPQYVIVRSADAARVKVQMGGAT